MKRAIINFCKWLLKPLSQFWEKPYSVKYVEDSIDNPKKKTLYVIGALDEPWQAELTCPCGCKDKIVLPLNDSTKPHWSLIITANNTPSLSPSVWRSKGCKSHFFLKQGKIDWC
ncbi:hypothetical protein MNBD_GAMMA12-354 [hydrothermal vent metagenome]|uniref:Uncharacterized protein n=1 Tax=hydrothermal vent metagenome TaxID=652676 RepID=A0A3B0ZEA2_9ZZZZ